MITEINYIKYILNGSVCVCVCVCVCVYTVDYMIQSGLWSGLCGLTERSGLWSGLCGLTERALERTLWAHGTERALERTLWAHGIGAGSGADSVYSRTGAGSETASRP